MTTEIELLEYKIKQLVEDNKSAWSTIRATENARVEAEKELSEIKAQPVMYFGLTKDHTWLSTNREKYAQLKPDMRLAVINALTKEKV